MRAARRTSRQTLFVFLAATVVALVLAVYVTFEVAGPAMNAALPPPEAPSPVASP